MDLHRQDMNTSATELSFDGGMIWVSLADGRKLGVPLAYFPRLLAATPEQLKNYGAPLKTHEFHEV